MTQNYERLCQLELADTLELLKNAFSKRARRTILAGQEVNTKSLRLQTFTFKGVTCAHCHLAATYFALERNGGGGANGRYHLNLWGTDADGEAVLFTHDHVIPLSRDGENNLENTQTMCSPCNAAKRSQMEWELETPDGTYVSCEAGTNPQFRGFYDVSSTTCRTMFPTYLEFDGKAWIGLDEFKAENGEGDVRWVKGSKPLAACPPQNNPFVQTTVAQSK